MAVCLKDDNSQFYLSLFREKLEKLKCPILGIGDESWLEELLLKPGELRLYLLNWLLSTQFLGQTNDLDELVHSPTNSLSSSSLKKLESMLRGLGFFKKNDDFIKGTVPIEEQVEIWEYLLNSALLMKSHTDARLDKFDGIEDRLFLETRYEADNEFIRDITRMSTFNGLFKNKVNLLPPDVTREMELMPPDEHSMELDIPSLDQLDELLKDINQNYTEEKSSLEILSYDSSFYAGEMNEKRDLLKDQLHDSCVQLLQLCQSFQQCFSNLKFSHDKPMPALSSIGSNFEECSSQLEKFHKLLSNLSSTKESYKKLQELHKVMTSSIRSYQFLSDMTLSEAASILQEST